MKHAQSGIKGVVMDSVTVVRIIAGVLFVAVLVLLIQRRRNKRLN